MTYGNDPELCSDHGLTSTHSYFEVAGRGRRCVRCDRPDAATAYAEAQASEAKIETTIARLEAMLRERRAS